MSRDEFDRINDYFKPLVGENSGALDLTDDVAVIDGSQVICSKDLLVEGVHFPLGEPKNYVARRALRTALSDIAAKGGTPTGYLVGCVWPPDASVDDFRMFTEGLAEDQTVFGCTLLGGDTTAHVVRDAPFTVSVTVFGNVTRSTLVSRAGATVGDAVFVSGSIGDGYLGLEALLDADIAIDQESDRRYLIERFRLPAPRFDYSDCLLACASASIDISDGLIADAKHIASASHVQIRINAPSIPVSEPAGRWIAASQDQEAALVGLACSGDDYELMFTVPQDRLSTFLDMSNERGLTPHKIGTVSKGSGVVVEDRSGNSLPVGRGGYNHFS
ncbi:MAG: thiamine-phosphate kinase [Pseudomonadota bacterium]